MAMELHVRACSARNLPNEHMFGDVTPFCKLKLCGKSLKTRVHEDGETPPVWNEAFVFSVADPQLDQLIIKVKDKNLMDNALIGECRLPVSMFLCGAVVDQWYVLTNESESAGEINLRIQYRGPGVQPSAPPSAQAYSYPQQPAAPGYPAAQQYPASSTYPPQQPYYQQPPPPHYAQVPPATAAYATGPPVMVVQGESPYGHHHHHGSPHGYGGGYGDSQSGGGGMSTGEMAMGVGAGVLGGMVAGDVLDDVFD